MPTGLAPYPTRFEPPVSADVVVFASAGQAAAQAKVDASSPGDVIRIVGMLAVRGTPFRLRSGRTYIGGAGFGYSGFRMANGANLDALVCSEEWYANSPTIGDPFSLYNLTIDGNSANQANGNGHGLVFINWQVRVIDCWVQNTRGDGIRLTTLNRAGSTVTGTPLECYFARCMIWNFIGGSGIRVEDAAGNQATDGWITDCVLANATRGILIDSGPGWRIDGNHVYSVLLDGISVSNCFATSVTGNYVELFGAQATGGNFYFGVLMLGLAGRASHMTDNLVALPSLAAGTAIGLSVHAQAGQAMRAEVAGNTYEGPGSGNGITFEFSAGGSLDVLLGPNAVWGTGLAYYIQSASVSMRSAGWVGPVVTTAAMSYNLALDDYMVIFTSSAAAAVLPLAAAAGLGKIYIVKNLSGSNISLTRSGADLIDFATSGSVASGGVFRLVSDGVSRWVIV